MEENMTTAVHPDQVLKELAELWVSLGKQEEPAGPGGVLRACAMTLVVLADGNQDPQGVSETLALLMREHPSRAIVVRLYDSPDIPLEAKVLAQCWLPFGSRTQICCEQIEITAARTALADIAALVMPLTAADLPVIAWNRVPAIVDQPGFEAILKVAGKLIVDSSLAPDLDHYLRRIDQFRNSGHRVADLAWARLTRWRELIAQVFENPTYLKGLPQLERVTIEFGGATPPPAALYLRMWLDASIRRAGGSVAYRMVPAPGAQQGSIIRVSLEDGGNWICIRKLDSGTAEVTVNSVTNCTVFRDSSDYILLREELSISGPDAVFESALADVAARANT